jgi:hypothetical protein|tara:strand:+ start:177 stop:626 length:450 start_codon:yes stop_codon:yes gene_type:complete
MVQRRSRQGKVIDFESMLASQGEERAMGNMPINAQGDVLGPNGEVIQKAEDRARAYYKDNPKSSTAQTSLKGAMPDVSDQTETKAEPELKTAEAQKTEADQSVMNAVEPAPEQPTLTEQRKIVGYKEVEQPNGDIEMAPVFEDDWSEDE